MNGFTLCFELIIRYFSCQISVPTIRVTAVRTTILFLKQKLMLHAVYDGGRRVLPVTVR